MPSPVVEPGAPGGVGLLELQRSAGNRAVLALFDRPQTLARLTVQRRKGGAGSDRRERARQLLPPAQRRPTQVNSLAAVQEMFGDLAARRLVRWAPAVLVDKELAIEAGTFLADSRARQPRLAWALGEAGGDSAKLRGLLAIVVEPYALEEVKWAWALSGYDADKTHQIVTLLDTYRADPAALGLARKALEDAHGDVGAAEADMTSLAKYGNDPHLRQWAGDQAGALAEEQVNTLKATAQDTYQASVEGLGPDTPHLGNKLSQWKKKANQEAKGANDAARLGFETSRTADIAAAETARPALTSAAQTAMETFLVQSRAAKLSQADSEWLLKRADGRGNLAEALRPLFGSGKLDGKVTTNWALARSSNDVLVTNRLVSGLLEALGAGLDSAASEKLVGVPGWPTLQVPAASSLCALAAANPAVLDRLVAWLTGAPSLADAVRLATTWVAKSGQLDEFVTVAEKTEPDRLTWLVNNIGLKASPLAIKALEKLLALVVETDITSLLAKLTPVQAERLVDKVLPDKQRVDPQLFAVLKKAPADQVVTWICTHGQYLHQIHKWLVDKKWAADDLDPLCAWASPNMLPGFLEDDTPTTLATLLDHDPNHLWSLRTLIVKEDEVQKWHPSLVIVANAHLVEGQWDKGSFSDPLHSVVYHYCKHVRNEGRAESVADYSNDAVALWTNWKHTSFNWNGGKKIQTAGEAGTYTNAGVPYSYWYT